MSDLTPKQKQFCIEYLKDFNGTQAAIRAGYSENTSYSISSENLKKPEVKEYVSELINEQLGTQKEQLRLKILNELNTIAFADVTNDINVISETIQSPITGKREKVQIVEIQDTEKSKQSAAIAEIKQNDKGAITIKYHDKVKSLELLGKFGAMWVDKIEHTGGVKVILNGKNADV